MLPLAVSCLALFAPLPCDLNDPQWRKRERATYLLVAHPPVLYAACSPEALVRVRYAAVLRQVPVWEAARQREQSLTARALMLFPTGWKQRPWIHIAVVKDQKLYSTLMEATYAEFTRDETHAAPWAGWRYATYLWIKHQLYAGKTNAWIIRKLNDMAWDEYDWIKRELENLHFARDYGGMLDLPRPPRAPRPMPLKESLLE